MMAELGHCLQSLRASKQLTLMELSQRTKIKETYLLALESGNYDQLPGDVYAKAFLRLYARELACDADMLLQLYDAAVSQNDTAPQTALAPRLDTKKKPRTLRWRIPVLRPQVTYWLFFGTFICTVVIGAWLAMSPSAGPDTPHNAALFPPLPEALGEQGPEWAILPSSKDSVASPVDRPPSGIMPQRPLSVSTLPEVDQDESNPVANKDALLVQIPSSQDATVAPSVPLKTNITEPLATETGMGETAQLPDQDGTIIVYPGRSEATPDAEPAPIDSIEQADESMQPWSVEE